MDQYTKKFWLDAWQNNLTRFHQEKYNKHLIKLIDSFTLKKGESTLVPLCGKSLDLFFLKERHLQVTGVELSKLAITQFFEENNLSPKYSKDDFEQERYNLDNSFSLVCSDFFSFFDTKKFSFIYDRACLIALSKKDQLLYVEKLKKIMSPKAQIFLIVIEYTSQTHQGPPYSISNDQVHNIFKDTFAISLLYEKHILTKDIKIEGIDSMSERVYKIKYLR